ncbi:hypothetical protein WUBG_12848 [Wuchereria bancrofti]|uniref:leucine--tRNA ligase n=1 Tax=Wuchereria bancrofti TaxID=6293 RepID=J9E271_WUCBA|nr:hypothetical protein WUBG_12848 [Wuchereria bancrofti]
MRYIYFLRGLYLISYTILAYHPYRNPLIVCYRKESYVVALLREAIAVNILRKTMLYNRKWFHRKKDGCAVFTQFEKMSKSKHNGIDPLSVLKLKGIDLTRLQLLNEAAPREPINWGDTELKGLFKFMERTSDVVSFYVEQHALSASTLPEPLDIAREEKYRTIYNFYVRNISMVIEVLHLHNTAIDHLQSFVKFLKKSPAEAYRCSVQLERCVHALVIMMQLFTPHLAAEYWAALRSVPALNGHRVWLDKEINEQPWPQVDPDANIDFMINVILLFDDYISVSDQTSCLMQLSY